MPHEYHFIFATVVFLITYAFIVLEKWHRAVVALTGAVIILLSKVLTQDLAIGFIDFNTIGLLIGMMVIVGVTRETGIFEFMAIWAAKKSKGEPIRIMVYLAVITAVASAFLDNVTTVLLIVPVTFSITRELKLSPIPFLITEIMASNIGGTATLIGDPPNIMIGSATGLTFMDFIINLTPIIIVIFVITIPILQMIFRKQMQIPDELKKNIMKFNEYDQLKDKKLMKQSLFVLALTIVGFASHGALELHTATIALTGAALLLLISKREPEQVFHAVEWPTIFFFAGLFIIVGSLEHVGVIEAVARKALEITGGAMLQTGLLVLWLSAIASAFVDNIPFTATMIPLIKDMGTLGGITNLDPLWWSLSLGACLGGNGTIIGAAANVIVSGLAEGQGYKITFINYMKIAFPLMILSIIISMVYLMIFYF